MGVSLVLLNARGYTGTVAGGTEGRSSHRGRELMGVSMVLLQCKARHGDKSRRVATGGENEWE